MIERVAGLGELNTHYTLTDIYKANALLDMRADMRAALEGKPRK